MITVTLELDAPADLHTGSMTVTLPRDAAVVGMTFARNGERLTAVARDAIDAGQAFDQVRVIKRDPALLEWTDRSEVRLSLYPVTAGEHPTVSMTITTPRFHRLLVDIGGEQHVLHGGTLASPSGAEIAAAHLAPAVTTGMSLLAMPPPSIDDVEVHVQNSQDAIHTCSLQADPDRPRDITLTILIGANGNVAEASADESPAGACAARLASSWRFGPGDRAIAMHYRLHLTPEPIASR